MDEFFPPAERSNNYFADMGTAAHHLVELCLREGSEPTKYLNRKILVLPDGGTSMLKASAIVPEEREGVFDCDVDMCEAVQKMTTYVRNRCAELGLIHYVPVIGAKDNDDKLYRVGDQIHAMSMGAAVAELVKRGTVRLEVHVTPLPDRDDTGGTGDVVIDAWPTLLEVVDYKNGSGVFVPVTGNMQLKSYGLGTLNEFGFDDYERVVYTICQPRHTEAPWDGIMSEEIPVPELKKWGNWLYGRAEEVDVARKILSDGGNMAELHKAGLLDVGEDGSACTWCSRQASCPAYKDKAQAICEQDFAQPPEEFEEVKSNNHLSTLVPWVPFLRKWCDSLMANAEAALLSGETVSGQKLIQGTSNRKRKPDITDDAIVEELITKGQRDVKPMYNDPKPATLRTIPQLEKLLPAGQRKAFSDMFTEKPPGKRTMVHEDHPSPAVSVGDVGKDFDDEPEVPA